MASCWYSLSISSLDKPANSVRTSRVFAPSSGGWVNSGGSISVNRIAVCIWAMLPRCLWLDVFKVPLAARCGSLTTSIRSCTGAQITPCAWVWASISALVRVAVQRVISASSSYMFLQRAGKSLKRGSLIRSVFSMAVQSFRQWPSLMAIMAICPSAAT